MSAGRTEEGESDAAEVKFGLIGLGRHGSRYAAHLLTDVPQARLVAVCRQDRKRGQAFARQHGLTFHGDYRRLIEDPRVEAIAVVVSPDLHVDICRSSAKAGKHIILEKPLATSLAEGHKIQELISASGVKFMLAQTLRFNSVVREIKRLKNRLGSVHLMAFNQRTEPFALAWRDAPGVGGNILDIGVHLFDLIHFLAEDQVEWVWCRRELIYHRHTEDLFAAILGLQKTGIICLVDSCRFAGGRSGRIELVGEKGQLVGDHIQGTLVLIEGHLSICLEPPAPVHTVQKALKVFVDCIVNDGHPPITAGDGLRTLLVAEMCYRSAKTGQVVRAEMLQN